MNKYIITAKLTCLILIPLCLACNNDIFIEDLVLPENTELSIEGDGGEVSIVFQPKGLENIKIDGFDQCYYNSDGEEIDPGNIADIARISISSNTKLLDILINGNELTFHSIENAAGITSHCDIVLYYGYITRYINLEIRAGEPMQLESISYAMDYMKNPRTKTERTTARYNNKGPQPATAEIRPYLGLQSTALIETEYGNPEWWSSTELNIPLPTYSDGKWVESARLQKVFPGMKHYYTTADWDLSVQIELPPHSSVNVITTVDFASIEIPFFITFRNPVTGRTSMGYGICTITEPVGYNIIIND